MKLQNNEACRDWEVEVTSEEFGCVEIRVKDPENEARIIISQVDALSLAKVLEEQVKENRRR